MTVPPGRDDIDTAWFFAVHTPITARDLVVESADEGVLLSDGNETPLEFPITFDADHLAIDAKGHIEVEEAVFDAEHFAYGGDTTGGAVRPVGAQPIPAPPGVFGDDAEIRLGADHLESLDTFRLTQVLHGDGYGITSQVELRPHRDLVEVDAGNTSWVRVDYREHGYRGTAVLENVTVDGPAAGFLRVPLDRPPWLIEQLFETTRSAGWAAPFVALPIVFASPALILGEALLRGFDCLLNDCPGEHPYPPWMAPGETGRFYYQVDASAATPGQYPGTITFTGANHPPVTIEMTVQVT